MKLRQTLLFAALCGFAPAVGWAYKVTVTEVASFGGAASETLASNIRETETSYATSAAPARDGYIFTGWRVSGEATLDGRNALGRARKTATYAVRGTSDVVLTADYLAEGVDTDDDGLPDGWELYWYGDLEVGAGDDTDGDGYASAQELARGTSPILSDAHIVGGVVSGGSSKTTVNPNGYATYTLRCEPEGALFATTEDCVRPGLAVTTASYSPRTSTFAYWTVDGVRQVDALGRAKRSVSFVPNATNGSDVVAVCLTDEQERFCQYYYGRTVESESDTDGDGHTFAEELARGSNPLLADVYVSGGVSSGGSEPAVCRFGSAVEIVVRSEPEGTLFATATNVVISGDSWTSSAYSPKTTAFAYWTVDGARQTNALGRAKTAVSVVAQGSRIEVVAHCVESERTRLGQYYYGRDVEDESDTDGDGYTFAEEIERGSNPLLADVYVPGGVFSDMSASASVDLQGLFTVTFDLGDRGERTGGGELVQRVEPRGSVEPPTVKPSEGWSLAGWEPSVTNVLASGTISAVYAPVAYEIRYEETKGSPNGNPTTYTIEDEVVPTPLGDVYGWTFAGWTPEKIAKGTTGAQVVTAQWEKMSFPVSFEGDGTSGYEYGTQVTLSTFSNVTNGFTNLVCRGWIGTGDVPATGVGTQVTFTITQASSLVWLYETNYWVSVEVAEDRTNDCWATAGTNLTVGAAVNEGWCFAGWIDVERGTLADSLPDGGLAERMILPVSNPWLLRASFTQQVCAVTFVPGEHGSRTGGGELEQSMVWGSAAFAPEIRARKGFVFLGWDAAFDRVTENTVVTALYEKLPGGTAGDAVTVDAPKTALEGSVTWRASGLPPGMKIAPKAMTDKTFGTLSGGTLYGRPTQPGSYVVRYVAKSGSETETFEVEVDVLDYEDESLPLEESYGVYLVGAEMKIELGEAFSGCKVKGLPTGLKFAAGTISGVPAKPCTNVVVFAKTASETVDGKARKVTRTASTTVIVGAAPAWLFGTFNGRLDDGSGSVAMTVAANGRTSGRIVRDGKTWAFAANGYEDRSIAATAKCGRMTAAVRCDVTSEGASGTVAGDGFEETFTLWRNLKNVAEAAEKLEPFAGVYAVRLASDETGYGYLSLTVDAKGNCKATGKIPDGTAVSGALPLFWNDGAPMALLQMSPSAYKGGYVSGLLVWEKNGDDRTVSGEDVAWVSKAPTATEEYGSGFSRRLSAAGAYHSKLAALDDTYGSLAFSADTPILDASEMTIWDAGGNNHTATVRMVQVEATELDCWGGLTLSPGRGGTSFVVDQGAATKPVIDSATGTWSYTGANDAALTFAFARATGIFRGSFVCWYDYVSVVDRTTSSATESRTHASRKVSFEGIAVPGDGMKGFYLWERTGESETAEKTQTFKYSESHPVLFVSP